MGVDEIIEEIRRKDLKQRLKKFVIWAMADTQEYFVAEIDMPEIGMPVDKELERCVKGINKYTRRLVKQVSKEYGEQGVENFAHDADLFREVIRTFMTDFVNNVIANDRANTEDTSGDTEVGSGDK